MAQPTHSSAEQVALIAGRIRRVSAITQAEFDSLNEVQLNWKTAANSWSIGQCLDHLIRSNETYFPLLDNLAKKNHALSFWERINPLSRYTGKNMVKTLGASVIRPFKAPRLFLPTSKRIRQTILTDFISHQEKLVQKIEQLNAMDLNKAIVTSPVAALITFPLSDCLAILAGHEERHLAQAMKVKNTTGFPA